MAVILCKMEKFQMHNKSRLNETFTLLGLFEGFNFSVVSGLPMDGFKVWLGQLNDISANDGSTNDATVFSCNEFFVGFSNELWLCNIGATVVRGISVFSIFCSWMEFLFIFFVFLVPFLC